MITNARYREILSQELRNTALTLLRNWPKKSVHETVFLALALAANGEFLEASQQLTSLNDIDVPESLQVFYLEARLLCDNFRDKGKVSKNTKQLIGEILHLEPQAAFARLIMASLMADERKYKQAEELIQEIIEDYPEARLWSVYLVQIQIRSKDFKSARTTAKNLPPGYWRTAYRVWANLIFPMACLWIVLVPLGILFLQILLPPEIFLLPAIFVFLLLLQAKRMKDSFSFSRLVYVLIIICIAMAISWYARS